MGTNAYANLSGHCPHKNGIKSRGENINNNEDKIAGRKPNKDFITKYTVIMINVAKIVFKRNTGMILSPPIDSITPKDVWNVGGYHKVCGLNLLSLPYLISI